MTAAGVERTLGLILGKIEGIEKSMAKADESRSRLYAKQEVQDEKLDDIDASVKDVAKRIGVIEPTVADINKWRERGIGAWLLIIGGSAMLGGVVSKAIAKLWALLTG